MSLPIVRTMILLLVFCLSGTVAKNASARPVAPSHKKAIWGPVSKSAFHEYRKLGAGIYEDKLSWAAIAPTRPQQPTNSNDPAYHWPKSLDTAIARAKAIHMRVSVVLSEAPSWANGGHASEWAPKRPGDFANFAYAAARRYPRVHLWMIWGEPSRRANFRPLIPERRRHGHRAPVRLNARQRRAPHLYARMLDAAYGALKRASRRNLVIGGDTFTTGDISPYNWIRNLRLPGGRPPRMDMYGHNPFTARPPDMRDPPLGFGFADFSNLDDLARWTDRLLRGRKAGPKHLPLFLSEFFIPTDHANREFNFWVDRRVAAAWLASAFRVTHQWSRIYTLGWFSLYDDPPNKKGDEVDRGLLDHRGRHKPAWRAYRRG